jgi:hypothetical protein
MMQLRASLGVEGCAESKRDKAWGEKDMVQDMKDSPSKENPK